MTIEDERKVAMSLLEVGHSVAEVSQTLNRSEQWVRKWKRRFERDSWSGLEDQSRAPRHHGKHLPEDVTEQVIQIRAELEEEAASGQGLRYIGGSAIRTRMKEKGYEIVPSVSTIERIIRLNGLTRCYSPKTETLSYPHLKISRPHTLCQVDIVPHFLRGGERVACFNAIDVGSRYPTGQAYGHRRSQEAMKFLVHVWQTLGIPDYTQVDNEGCFSGGATHPYVLGKVVRLALSVGTQLLFSPFYHPKSNGFVERFHQDYNDHVWKDTELTGRNHVQQKACSFFQQYRQRPHPKLQERTPQQVHFQTKPIYLQPDFQIPSHKQPLTEGSIHFLRQVADDQTILIFNVKWAVPKPPETKTVWATLKLKPQHTQLFVYDLSPQHPQRRCLVQHPFLLSEPVLPRKQTLALDSQLALLNPFSNLLNLADSWLNLWFGKTNP